MKPAAHRAVKRAHVPRSVSGARAGRPEKREGFALLLAVIALTILAVLVADLHETTGTSFAAAIAERDQLRAEYLARSGLNLTRMLIAQERPLRILVQPIFAMMPGGGRTPPQIPVWRFADAILRPFSDFDNSKEDAESAGFDLGMSEGLGKTGGTFSVLATAENGKLSLNDPHLADGELSKKIVAGLFMQLIAPPKYDPLFSALDEKGRTHTRGDLVTNVIDWWDLDEQRTNYDPVLNAVQSSGGEDVDYYRGLDDPYTIKGAPFDTLEELRLVRGMNDDIWATLIEPDLEDPGARTVTIWGGTSTNINVNEAAPAVLLARICSFNELRSQALCSDPLESTKFSALIQLLRSYGVPAFGRRNEFVDFLKGKPSGIMSQVCKLMSSGMGAMLGIGGAGGGSLAGGSSTSGSGAAANQPCGFAPLVFPAAQAGAANIEQELQRTFATSAKIFSIEVTGHVGRAVRRIRAVVNMDSNWQAPKPNAAQAPPLGVFAYYRVE